ncbi:8-oxo-dGTP diphosphatase MutT [Thiotrichales bacterium 19S9-12]|nr:8-oxo-dGTP diphosphatase MutT [Thiotrichales bacterium 19S9-11]MCF6811171.1 8-oxo-dGTP diphosphatase MutT [Thiotrichales bacterium 19S9-12]
MILKVAVGIIIKNNQVYLTQRKKGAHLEEFWEFPGGKVKGNELNEEGLARELQEEINIIPTDFELYRTLSFEYPERSVLLSFYLINQYKGDIKPNEGQKFLWVSLRKINKYQLPEANKEVIESLLKDFVEL